MHVSYSLDLAAWLAGGTVGFDDFGYGKNVLKTIIEHFDA